MEGTRTGLRFIFLHATLHPASQPGTSKIFFLLLFPTPFLLHLLSNDAKKQDLDAVARVSAGSERGRGSNCMFRRAVDQEFLSGLALLGSAVQWLTDCALEQVSLCSWDDLAIFSGQLMNFFFLFLFCACLCPWLRGAADALLDSRCERKRVWPGALRLQTLNSALRCSRGDETKREPASVSPFVPSFASLVWCGCMDDFLDFGVS